MNATAKPIIMPPGLKKGDTIGLVTPAGPITERTGFERGIKILAEHGYRVKAPDDLFSSTGYLAGTDRDRARQFTDVWLDPEIKMVLAVRGGYGCLRLLPLLDLERLAATPKILAGFSDLTVLLNEFAARTGLVTFHAPMLNTLGRCDDASLDSFLALLAGKIKSPIRPDGLHILRSGNGRGPLIGGNLACLGHLVGTPHEPSWEGAILFLEDTGEPLYRVDRMLTHLERAGCLRGLAGLILGTFTNAKGEEESWSEQAWERALEVAGDDYPVWGNFPVGHGGRNLSLPMGAMAVLDSDSGSLGFPIS